MFNDRIEEMSDGKEKELLKILNSDAKPFLRKVDGYAVKCTENKTITWKDHENVENTVEVPEGSYIVTDGDSCYPKIVTAEDFEKKNKFIDGEKPKPEKKKKESGHEIGIESLSDKDY